jgi:cell wall-associated NlpC family hydrolase
VVSKYVVKRGDNLAKIARTTGVTVAEIKRANNLSSDRITVGKTLVLPGRARPEAAVALSPTIEDGFDEEGDGEIVSEDSWAATERDKQQASDLLGKWRNPQERTALIKAATLLLGTPYRFGGETVRGIDCSAFVRAIYGIFGVQLPRTAREQSFVGMVVGRDSLKEGDLVFFNTRRALGHVGIYIGDNKFLHASYRSKAVRVDSMETPYFQRRFVRAVRLKELEDEMHKTAGATHFPR